MKKTLLCITALTLSLMPLLATATAFQTEWSFELTVQKNAPTPDAASKALASAAGMLGSVSVAAGLDRGTMDAKGFQLYSQVKGTSLMSAVSDNLNMTRQSRGVFVNGFPLTLRYSDKRGSTPELVTTANTAAKKYEFSKGGKPSGSAPLNYVATDLAMLPYTFLGKSAPSKPSFVAFTDGKAIRALTLNPSAGSVKIAGKDEPAVRLNGASADGGVTLWVRPSDGYPLKMSVALGSKYGAILEQTAKAIPAADVVVK
jgi:hypothetical protein